MQKHCGSWVLLAAGVGVVQSCGTPGINRTGTYNSGINVCANPFAAAAQVQMGCAFL
jgi:hypothetical protein